MSSFGRELCPVFRALSDPTRCRIVEMLLAREMCVCEIAAELAISQPLASHHLRDLKLAGLIKDRRMRHWVFYTINRNRFAEVCLATIDAFESIPEEPAPSSFECEPLAGAPVSGSGCDDS